MGKRTETKSKQPRKAAGIALTALLGLFLFSACTTPKVKIYQTMGSEDSFPFTVAVLPFTEAPEIAKGHNPHLILREVFYNYFCYLGFTDLPLEEVDRKLRNGNIDFAKIAELSPTRLKELLGVDAVIMGHVSAANNFTGGIHAQTTLTAKLEMIDLHEGKILWMAEHNEYTYSGVASVSIWNLIKDQMANAKVQEAYHRVAEEFSLKVLHAIPDPAQLRQADLKLPVIDTLQVNLKANRHLRPNDTIYVSLLGQPGMEASFDIGDYKTIPLKEITPGLYTGGYQISMEDRFTNALIIGTLKDPQGLTAKKIFRSGLATLEHPTSGRPAQHF